MVTQSSYKLLLARMCMTKQAILIMILVRGHISLDVGADVTFDIVIPTSPTVKTFDDWQKVE